MIQKLCFILNPVSGEGNPQEAIDAFIAFCSKHGFQGDVHLTEEDEDYEKTVSDAISEGYQIICVGGGDGTVGAVASSLVGKKIPMGIIPTGTGNLLAKKLGIPLNLEDAFNLLTADSDRISLDTMQVGGRNFLLNLGIGLSSNLIGQTSREDKNRLGILAYFWSGLRVFFGFQPHHFSLKVDGEGHNIRASEVFFSNYSLTDEDFLLPDIEIRPDDGRIELIIIKARSLWNYLSLGMMVLMGQGKRSREMVYFPVEKEASVKAEGLLVVQADGDVIGNLPVTVKVIPRGVEVIVPEV